MENRLVKKSIFALRLRRSLIGEVRKIAKAEGVSLNRLINMAVAEKVSALRTEDYFAERAGKGDVKTIKRAGTGNPPVPGDELSPSATRRHR